VPYGDVVEVEQELISERLAPGRSAATLPIFTLPPLKGTLDHTGAKTASPGTSCPYIFNRRTGRWSGSWQRWENYIQG